MVDRTPAEVFGWGAFELDLFLLSTAPPRILLIKLIFAESSPES
jgi:hypothetical protein